MLCYAVLCYIVLNYCTVLYYTMGPKTLRLLNALNSEDRGLKVRFSLATIAFETFELILCQMLSSQGKNAPSNPYPHYLVRLAASRNDYTHTHFIIWELISQMHRTSVTQGLLAGIILCNWAPSQGIFCERANYTH